MQPLERDNIRLAATVMLVRDTPQGLEVYMVQRPGRGAFPDLHVFPGGKVDEDDFAPGICYGIDDAQASQRLGVSVGGVRYWVAVARECFEECGVLMLRRDNAIVDFSNVVLRQEFSALRKSLLAGEISFAQMCHQQNLTVACDLLGYFSHWITPQSAPRRFDTRFFLAGMPATQHTLADTQETADDQWERPAQALESYRRGDWQMIDPTLRCLETLSQYSTVAEALARVHKGDHLMPHTRELESQGMQPLR